MTAGWVAAGVRAKALVRHRLGGAGARDIAATGDATQALDALAAGQSSPYSRDVRLDQDLAAAQHAIAAAYLWNLRVLAGWLPSSGVAMLRVVAGWFEIANVENSLRRGTEPMYELAGLATSWPALSSARDAADVRRRLTTSWWQDPGDESPAAIGLAMRSRLLEAATGVPGAQPWGVAAAALLVARQRFVAARPLPAVAARRLTRLLGRSAGPTDDQGAGSLRQFAERLPTAARWVLDGVGGPDDLWLGEARWWGRVEGDGWALLRRPVTTSEPVVGAAAVLAHDAWRARAALAAAAHGTPGAEAYDALG